jgi:glycosyltransferase involved in cell wall biosynthesis
MALYLGHIPHGTDLDLALAALARIGEGLPRARLVIAGVGDGLPALQARAGSLGVAERIIFPGWIERERAHLYLAAADVAVNPYRDTLINRAKCAGKVVAAMAMGKAVITSRVGENPSYIEHGRSGWLVDPGDVDDLARALHTLLSDPALAAELGRNARQRIWDRFDWSVRVAEVEQCYEVAREAARGQRA